jgi:endoglucanase
VQVPVKGTIYVFWSAKYSRAGDTLTVSGESWNRSLKSGESTAFGWCSNF